MRFLLFCLFLLTSFGLHAQDSVAVEDWRYGIKKPASAVPDSSVIHQRTFDQERLDELRRNADFDYRQPPSVAESLWDRFVLLLDQFFGWLLRNAVKTNWGRLFLYTLGFVVLVVIILMLLKVDALRVLYSGADKGSLNYKPFEENIHEMDFDQLIRQSLEKKEYRSGVRLTFLYALKLLSDKHHVDWRPGKTNHDYLEELRAAELKTGFNELSFYFDYAWYGDFSVNESTYEKVHGIFEDWREKGGMKRDWKYILYLSIAFGLFVAVKLMEPKQYDWNPTYAIEDKNPFGGYVLNELIQDLFKDKKVDVSNLTVYELKDSLKAGDNLIILSHSFRTDKEDTKVMLNHVEKGGHVFIGAESFYGKLSDTLKLETYDYLFHAGLQNQRRDTSYLSFANGRLDSTHRYSFRRDNIHNYFGSYDTTRTTIIARNDRHQPVTIRVRWGKGCFIFTCTPLAFSNIYALRRDNHEFMAITLSHLPEADVKWTEYYSVGRPESSTPLRFILTHPPLAWAYYITVLALLLFMIFEAKRKQRIIPIMLPLQNTSLEFVGTIGNLYYQRSDHKNIADKKILFFLEMIRSRYLLSPGPNASNFISQLARKSGKPEQSVTRLFKQIDFIRGKTSITKEQLIDLNKAIEAFTSQDKK